MLSASCSPRLLIKGPSGYTYAIRSALERVITVSGLAVMKTSAPGTP